MQYQNREKFLTYEKIRLSGETNMFDVAAVVKISKKYKGSELTAGDVLTIFRSYDAFKQEYLPTCEKCGKDRLELPCLECEA